MKKLLSLLFVFSLIACVGDNDDDTLIDPLIGTWFVESNSYTFVLIFDSNGTFTSTATSKDGGFFGGESPVPTLGGYPDGNWVNTENENYTNYKTLQEYQINSIGIEFARILEFSDDFNSFVIPEEKVRLDYGLVYGFTYVRQ